MKNNYFVKDIKPKQWMPNIVIVFSVIFIQYRLPDQDFLLNVNEWKFLVRVSKIW